MKANLNYGLSKKELIDIACKVLDEDLYSQLKASTTSRAELLTYFKKSKRGNLT